MAYFDFLIDRGNAPKPIEYIYRHDYVWFVDKLECKPMERNTIVTDVVQRPNGAGYEFTIKSTGERVYCTYAWAFAENTRENLRRIKRYEKAMKKYLEMEFKADCLRNEIITLKI